MEQHRSSPTVLDFLKVIFVTLYQSASPFCTTIWENMFGTFPSIVAMQMQAVKMTVAHVFFPYDLDFLNCQTWGVANIKPLTHSGVPLFVHLDTALCFDVR